MMRMETADLEIYTKYVHDLGTADFLQSEHQALRMKETGWNVEYLFLKDGDQIKGAAMCATMPLMKVFRYAYIPRGMIMDYNDEQAVKEFLHLLKEHLKKQNVIYLEIDPQIILKERDQNGNIVEGGENNERVVSTLKQAGMIQLPLKTGYDLSKQCRWVSVLNLKGKTEQQIFSEFSYMTRQDIRTSEKNHVKIRELNVSELEILDQMEQETSEHQGFQAMSLEFYRSLYQYYGECVKTVYAYLDMDEYESTLNREYEKVNSTISELKEFIEVNPNSEKKKKRLKTEEEHLAGIQKKKNSFGSYRKKYGNEIPLACCLFIGYGNNLTYLVGASNYECRNFRGPYAVQWYMIREAIAKGYERYNFYGISGYFNPGEEGYGVFDYKRGFNAVVEEYIGNFLLPVRSVMFNVYRKMKKF
ncbi:MAG: peptidoglycan bridge formation glycyltransferase FemA/FemB family protein [Bulleidia sp.]